MAKAPTSRWLLVIAVLAILVGTGLLAWRGLGPQADEPGPPAQDPTVSSRPKTALEPAPSLAEAFHAAYGADGADGAAEATVGENRYRISAETLERVGDFFVLVTRADNQSDCHACGGAMGIHYLRRDPGGGLRVFGRWPDLVPGSSFGNATTGWTVRRDLATHPVLVNEGGFTGQGYTCSWANLVELDPAGPQLRGQVWLGYDDAGAIVDGAAPTEYSGRIVRPVRGRSFEIDYGGSETFTERYVLNGGRYTRVGESRFRDHC